MLVSRLLSTVFWCCEVQSWYVFDMWYVLSVLNVVNAYYFECLIKKAGVSGDAVGWGIVPQDGRLWARFLVGSLEIFQVTYSFCPHSVALGSTQLLTEMSTKEFSWGWSVTGTQSWQLCHPSCAKCQSKDGSLTFPSPSEFPWLVTGKLKNQENTRNIYFSGKVCMYTIVTFLYDYKTNLRRSLATV
jgi:hypothetical protein